MSIRDVRRVQDSVHGLMEFRGTEAVVVDVLRRAELQRLRRIRQLGLAHYVFPGAEHTRFTHSLGAAHLALRFAHHVRTAAAHLFVPTLVPDEYAIADLALAALCHDLGHGPLSHAWEREIIGESFDRRAWAGVLGISSDNPVVVRGKWHEMSCQAQANTTWFGTPPTSICFQRISITLLLLLLTNGKATPVQDDPILMTYRSQQPTQRRLFTVRAAVDAALGVFKP